MASKSSAPRANRESLKTNTAFISVLVDGNTLKSDKDRAVMSYHGGFRAATDLRTNVLECLRSEGLARSNIDVFIHFYTKAESPNTLITPGTKELLADFRRGFNASDPLSTYEDLIDSGSSGAGDLLLKSLKAEDCIKVIVAKPCGPTFQAMIKAQRQNGALPNKLMEVTVHTNVVRPAQDPYPLVAIASPRSQEDPSQNRSRSNKYIHNCSDKAGAVQASTPQASSTPPPCTQASSTPTTSTQALSTPAPTTQATTPQEPSSPAQLTQATLLQASLTQAAGTQASTRRFDPQRMIPRNKGGQRVDPQVEALGWLVNEARSRKICYEHHLHGKCGWQPSRCPKAHLTTNLNIHQLNTLRFLTRGIPCGQGSTCLDWKCCFGHRCPFGESCNRKQDCRFSLDMHFADTKVVN